MNTDDRNLARCSLPNAPPLSTPFMVEPRTAGSGSVWDVVISRDSQQKWLFLADGRNNQVLTLDRQTGAVVNTLGRSGRYAGEFHWVHDLAIDSQGNLFAGESTTASVCRSAPGPIESDRARGAWVASVWAWPYRAAALQRTLTSSLVVAKDCKLELCSRGSKRGKTVSAGRNSDCAKIQALL
ncbi:MAG: hypothetical protein JSS14_22865 [Proteobacteria bacterium]|nr:hypothetical protein [Pseudomonadota bacterium]